LWLKCFKGKPGMDSFAALPANQAVKPSRSPRSASALVCTGSRVYEFRAEFEVRNFQASCAANAQPGPLEKRCIKGPVATFGDVQLQFRFLYEVEANLNLNRDAKIGIDVTRTDGAECPCFALFGVDLLNRNPMHNVTLRSKDYRSFPHDIAWGWATGVSGWTFDEVLADANGWLHNGAVRAHCWVNFAAYFEKLDDYEAEASHAQSVCDSLRSFLDSGTLADLTLRVGSDKILVHSQILAARSPVFQAMLLSQMRESSEKEVVISDLDAGAVRELVSFFYTGDVGADALRDDESTLRLLEAAHRYDAELLVKYCAAALTRRFTVENVSERLELADMIGCRLFKDECLEFMRLKMSDVQGSAGYERLVQRRPGLLKDLVAMFAGPPSKRARTAAGSDS